MDKYDEANVRATARSIWTIATVLLVIYVLAGIIYAIYFSTLPAVGTARTSLIIGALIFGAGMAFAGYVMYLYARAAAHIMLTLSQIETDLRGGSAVSTNPAPPAQPDWFRDPRGRFELRYFDGTKWTDHVANHGVRSQDPW